MKASLLTRPTAKALPRNGQALELQPIYAYGDSYIASDGSGTAGNKYVERIRSYFRMGALTNHGAGGIEMSAVARRINGNTATKWVPGTKGLVVISSGNQLHYTGFTSAPAIAALTNALRSALAGVSCASKVDSVAMTKVGTWSLTSNSAYNAGSIAWSTTDGDYAEASVTVNATGKVDVVLMASDAAWAFSGSAFEIRVDGILVHTGTMESQNVKTVATEAGDGAPMVVTLSGLTPGARMIRITKIASTGTKYLYVDAFMVRSLTPPPVLLFTMPRYNWASMLATWPAYAYTMTDAELYAANAMFRSVAAEFPNVYVAETEPGFEHATMVPVDNLHLGDKGQAHFAAAGIAAAKAIPFSPGLNTGVL